jgi:hypothetical protein
MEFTAPRRGADLVRKRARIAVRAAAFVLLVLSQGNDHFGWPEPLTARRPLEGLAANTTLGALVDFPSTAELASADVVAIRRQPVCVASTARSFGTLGRTLLFVHERDGDELRVGYFAYWSTERPWGDNALTYTLLPALAVDATYSHFLFLFPGLQRVLYGPGDVEGALVVYDVLPSGALSVRQGMADDGTHDDVVLDRSDLLAADGRVVLLTQVWSHQLGARGASTRVQREGLDSRCFEADSLRPLTPDIARRFRLGSAQSPMRARPAWRATRSGP